MIEVYFKSYFSKMDQLFIYIFMNLDKFKLEI